MEKKNCWEYIKCGHQPGGHAVADGGVCPVAECRDLNGIHGGKNAGRACWAVDESLCPEVQRKSAAKKFNGCWKCEFYHLVKDEEQSSLFGFIMTYREMIVIQRNLRRLAEGGLKERRKEKVKGIE